jgi:hypothetical protein
VDRFVGIGFVALIGFGFSCATPRATCPSTPTVVAVAGSSAAPALPPRPPIEPAIVRGEKCFARGRPRATLPASTDVSSCGALDATEVKRAEEELRRRFVAYEKPSKLVVDFGCDVAHSEAAEIVVEDGSGHGGSLRIARLVRAGNVFTVRTLSSLHYRKKGLSVTDATVPAAQVDAIIAQARVQMLARPHLVLLTSPRDALVLTSSFSSNDFHLRLSIVDDAGRMTDRFFTGYPSSSSQEERLPLEIATEPLLALLSALPATASEVSDEDRTFFSARMRLMAQGHAEWWVKERFAEDARELGTVDTIPALVAIAREKSNGNTRRQDLAIDVLAKITGWNARIAEDGTTRTTDEAARALEEDCAM